ncbi:hypothetical protein K2X14_14985 [Acetobacter sp. TBRC 12305]|uniref:Uncharacterized protein n=1 Tax=Acetobacter garciniae TaxID=2817435 RepID=A0A939HPN2_9PROT|nr:hypothetical protein [Acetobacter garciniae]MBO1326406.1 hypothetical protein [Acetobacter garciniae]MBX0346139.1 hypothetical protein [Acetobacter garciniae]
MTEDASTQDQPTGGAEAEGWKVRILDLSGPEDDNTLETVGVFHDLAHANAFARAYVRDSVERCRTPGASARDVLEAWFTFGEDAQVIDAGDDGWRSANELDDFTATPATTMERDWRMLDPRRLIEDDEAAIAEAYAEGDEEEDGFVPPRGPDHL